MHRSPTRPHRRMKRGFSLIEVMVVVVIIGMLAGAVALKVTDYMDSARVNRARSDLATLVNGVEKYYLDHGSFPGNSQGLEKISVKNKTDPWGNPYQYNRPGREGEPFEVICFGADGREGGEGINADIYSWQLNRDDGERGG